jgi:hypothetical protein
LPDERHCGFAQYGRPDPACRLRSESHSCRWP